LTVGFVKAAASSYSVPFVGLAVLSALAAVVCSTLPTSAEDAPSTRPRHG